MIFFLFLLVFAVSFGILAILRDNYTPERRKILAKLHDEERERKAAERERQDRLSGRDLEIDANLRLAGYLRPDELGRAERRQAEDLRRALQGPVASGPEGYKVAREAGLDDDSLRHMFGDDKDALERDYQSGRALPNDSGSSPDHGAV